MNIQGLQKLTLLDYPGKVACTVFFAGCNFRCPFCHNASLVVKRPEGEAMGEEAFFSFLRKRTGILDGVCITGGEPLMQPGLEEFIRKMKSLGFLVKLDTNGSFPERLRAMVEEGLCDYVAMDIKNAPEAYGETTGTDDGYLEQVKESVSFLLEGKVPYEFRTTVTKNFHSREGFENIGRWIMGADAYYLQNFVDSGDLIGKGQMGCTRKEMEEYLKVVQKYVPGAKLRGIA